jgi:hypothetical protein
MTCDDFHPLVSMGATMRRYCARVEAIPSASPRVVRVVFPLGRRPVLRWPSSSGAIIHEKRRSITGHRSLS